MLVPSIWEKARIFKRDTAILGVVILGGIVTQLQSSSFCHHSCALSFFSSLSSLSSVPPPIPLVHIFDAISAHIVSAEQQIGAIFFKRKEREDFRVQLQVQDLVSPEHPPLPLYSCFQHKDGRVGERGGWEG